MAIQKSQLINKFHEIFSIKRLSSTCLNDDYTRYSAYLFIIFQLYKYALLVTLALHQVMLFCIPLCIYEYNFLEKDVEIFS